MPDTSVETLVPPPPGLLQRRTEDGFILTDLAHEHELVDPRIHKLPSNEEVAEAGSFHRHHLRRSSKESREPTLVDKELPPELVEDDSPLYVEYAKGDPRNPFNFTRTRKWAMTMTLVAFTSICGATGPAYAMGYKDMTADLNCSQELAALGLSIFALGFALAPLLLASFSEEFGRLPMYIVSAALNGVFFIPIALARNIETVIVFRFLQGIVGSTGSTLVGGTLADIWITAERGIPMSLFALLACITMGLGPVAVSYVDMSPYMGWRWIQWLGLIYNTIVFVAMVIFLKETRASVLLTREARKLRSETGNNRYRARVEDERSSLKTLIYVSSTRPFYLLVSESIVLSFSLWVGFAWGMLYCLLESIPYVFENLYGFNTGEVGLAFLSIVIGVLIGWISNFYQERLYHRNFSRIGPEARLYCAMVAGVLFPVGAFIYAWTSSPNIPWIAPLIGITVLATGIFIIYLAAFSYLADAYLMFASSALAGQSLSRNLMGFAFPLFTISMYERLTPHWASTLIALLAAVLGVVPFILFFWGSQIRERSFVAKKMAAFVEDS